MNVINVTDNSLQNLASSITQENMLPKIHRMMRETEVFWRKGLVLTNVTIVLIKPMSVNIRSHTNNTQQTTN